MATGAVRGSRQRGSGRGAVAPTVPARAGRRGRRPVDWRVVAALLALLVLEVGLFLLAGSKGSPSWRAGYHVGVRLGRATIHSGARQPLPAVPPTEDCIPTQQQLETGITTRKVVIGAHQLDRDEFQRGCIAGYQVALANRVTLAHPTGTHPKKPAAGAPPRVGRLIR